MPLFHSPLRSVAGRQRQACAIAITALLMSLLLLPLGRSAAAEFEIGASLGAIRSVLGGSSPPGSSFASRASGSAGIAIAWRVTRDVSLLMEPGYTVRGAKVTVEQLNNPDKLDLLDFRIPYVAFPLGIRVESSGHRGFVVGGLEARWLQKAEAKLLVDPGGTTDLTDQVSPWDLAMNMGAGYAVPWGPAHFSLEARYSQGLLNLDRGVSHHMAVPFPVRLRTTGMGLILRFMTPLHIGSERG